MILIKYKERDWLGLINIYYAYSDDEDEDNN